MKQTVRRNALDLTTLDAATSTLQLAVPAGSVPLNVSAHEYHLILWTLTPVQEDVSSPQKQDTLTLAVHRTDAVFSHGDRYLGSGLAKDSHLVKHVFLLNPAEPSGPQAE